jgi:putative transposase
MALALGQAHNLYSRTLNRARRRSGHLWQNRFFSAPLGRDHLRLAVRYVDLNPVRAGLAAGAVSYRWSSAAAHQRMSDPCGLIDQRLWREICPRGDRAAVLRYGELEAAWMTRFRSATKRGKPLGDKDFVEELERRAGKELTLRSRGRPGKARLLAISREAGG